MNSYNNNNNNNNIYNNYDKTASTQSGFDLTVISIVPKLKDQPSFEMTRAPLPGFKKIRSLNWSDIYIP